MKTNYTDEKILNQIYVIRGQKVMFDSDLAILYEVETKRLKEAVRRNINRFPEDFMFQLTQEELENQRSQFASFNLLKYRPFCFTEQGVTMLACILNSPIAIQMNIRIIRLFTKMRETLFSQKEILARLDLIEKRVGDHDEGLVKLFEVIHHLLDREQIRVRSKSIGYNKPRE
jgi:hypothetical protein